MKRIKTYLAIATIFTISIIPMSAQFMPLGMPVYDSAVNLEQLLQTAKLVAQLKQLADTYREVKGHYDTYVQQVTYLKNMANRYKSPTNIWKGITAQDTYGRNGGWITAANSGTGSLPGWQRATQKLETYGSLNSMPSAARDRAMLDVAGLELADGVGVGAIDAIGRIRANGPATEQTLARLEADAFSTSAEMQTSAAQRNHSNAVALLQAKALSDSNKLAAAETELRLIQLRQERESAARALAIEAYRTSRITAPTSDLGGEFRAYRVP